MEIQFFAMGCPCTIHIVSEGKCAEEACEAAVQEVRRLEGRYSRYDSDSLLSAINRAAKNGGSIQVDDETAFLIDRAFEARESSDRLFDITSGVLRAVWNDDLRRPPTDEELAPLLARIGMDKLLWRWPTLSFLAQGMELDLGGIVKEYAADRAAQKLVEAGEPGGFVSLGGDLAVLGPQADGAAWRIGVSDPKHPENALATLFVTRGGVATSGLYERFWEFDGVRYGHLLDPRTGRPIDGPPSVTVADVSCLTAGLSATIALLLADRGLRWLDARGSSYLYIDAEGAPRGPLIAGPLSDAVSP